MKVYFDIETYHVTVSYFPPLDEKPSIMQHEIQSQNKMKARSSTLCGAPKFKKEMWQTAVRRIWLEEMEMAVLFSN